MKQRGCNQTASLSFLARVNDARTMCEYSERQKLDKIGMHMEIISRIVSKFVERKYLEKVERCSIMEVR